MYSGHYTSSVDCRKKWNILLQLSKIEIGWYPKLLYCICNNIVIDYVTGFRLEQGGGSLITPMVLAHPLHPITSMSRNTCKHWKLWVRWRVSWWHYFWSIFSFYYHIHTMYLSCILSNWNMLLLGDIYIPRVGVAITVCWMIRYGYSFQLGFNYR